MDVAVLKCEMVDIINQQCVVSTKGVLKIITKFKSGIALQSSIASKQTSYCWKNGKFFFETS